MRAPGSLRVPLAAAFATVAASICLGPVFLTGAWFFPTVFGVLVVAAGCEVGRRMSVSRATVPLGGLLALAAYLLLRYAYDEAFYGLLPTTASIDRLGQVLASGRADMNRYAAPIGVSPGIELLTVGGVGLVALVVDTLAVTWRRAALAGLPLLVLYTVPTAIAPDGVSWVAFAIAGTAFLTLLLTESRERVSRWGRPMRYTTERPGWKPQAEVAPLGQVGRRVGATALGLALVVPAVLPDLTVGSFGLGGGGFGRGGGGGSSVVVVNPILRLGDDLRQGIDQPVIQYRGPATYLRLVGLDSFTGQTWEPSQLRVSRSDNDVENGLARAPGLSPSVSTKRRSYQIRVFDLDQRWLPLPYPTTKVSAIDGRWLYDESTFNVFGENSSTRQISYRVSALSVTYDPDQLRRAGAPPSSVQRYLELPRTMDPQVEATAREVTRGLVTDYDRALAVQDFLRGFSYSQTLDSSVGDGNGDKAIVAFLDSRRGYCVQFASTMAVMARILGIPARVAVGFAAGSDVGQGEHVVGVHDAHAWPELYFQGAGWVPFEPTPGGPAAPPPSWAQQQPGGGSPTSTPTTSATSDPRASGGVGASTNRDRTDIFKEAQRRSGTIGGGPVQLPVVPTLVVLGVLLLAAVPALTRLVVRRRRWRNRTTPAAQALAAWDELQDVLLDHGYDWDPADPPRRGADRLVAARSLVGEPAAAVHRVADATDRARYAPELTEVGDLRADLAVVRTAIADGCSGWERWRARLLPRSTRAVSVAVSERLADGLDAVDSAATAVTSRLRLGRS